MKKNRALLKIELRNTILDLFSREDMYGYQVINKIEIDGEKIEPPRIYVILKELYNEGLLKDRWERSGTGPSRRIYSLDEKGRAVLRANLLQSISAVRKDYGKYLMSLHPQIDITGEIINRLLEGIDGKKKTAFFTNHDDDMTKTMISNIQRKVPEGRVYLIKPRSVEIITNYEKVEILSGRYEDIPLKDGFVDLLIINDLPEGEQLMTAIKEWHRVLNSEGNLGIITPSVLVKERVDPIDIGDYMAKLEHEVLGKSNYIDEGRLKKGLRKFFRDVENHLITHLTLILAKQPKQNQ